MKPKAYLETTIVSYLAAAPSRDIVIAGHQQVTREWWDRRDRFELFVSQAVVEEAARGDTVVAARRIALLSGMPVSNLAKRSMTWRTDWCWCTRIARRCAWSTPFTSR